MPVGFGEETDSKWTDDESMTYDSRTDATPRDPLKGLWTAVLDGKLLSEKGSRIHKWRNAGRFQVLVARRRVIRR